MNIQLGSLSRALPGIIFGALVLTSQSANAALTLRLDDGVNPAVTVVDGDGDGIVGFSGSLGVWTVNVATGLSKPILGGATLAEMDLNSVNVSIGVGTLTISLSDDNFSLPGSTGFGVLDIGGTTANAVKYGSWIDLGNTLFAQSILIGSSSFGPGGGAFSDSLSSSLLLSNPFSMTTSVTIGHNARTSQVTSFNANTRVSATVPEPATLGLLGGGLIALGYFARRLRRRASA